MFLNADIFFSNTFLFIKFFKLKYIKIVLNHH